MNKVKNKVLAGLCALGCTFSGGKKNIEAISQDSMFAIGSVVVPILGGILTLVGTYYFSKRDQRKMDSTRTKEVEKSNFKFDTLDANVARAQMQAVADLYPYAAKECEIIMDFICGAIETKHNNPKAQIPVLSLDGIPGCGKTSMLKKMLHAIGIEPVIISPTDVDKGNKKVSTLQQAYGSWTSRAGDHFIQVDAPLTKALKVNKDYTCVLFDDADKFDSEVIQGFWNIADGGKIKSGDNYIDTSKLFTFVTSNKSINRLADQMLTDSNKSVDEEWVKAIKTRFMCLTIPAPRKEDYTVSLRELLNELSYTYSDIQIMIKENVIDSIAELFFKNGKCMRNINECRIYLAGALSRFRSQGISTVELKIANGFVNLVEYVEENEN